MWTRTSRFSSRISDGSSALLREPVPGRCSLRYPAPAGRLYRNTPATATQQRAPSDITLALPRSCGKNRNATLLLDAGVFSPRYPLPYDNIRSQPLESENLPSGNLRRLRRADRRPSQQT